MKKTHSNNAFTHCSTAVSVWCVSIRTGCSVRSAGSEQAKIRICMSEIQRQQLEAGRHPVLWRSWSPQWRDSPYSHHLATWITIVLQRSVFTLFVGQAWSVSLVSWTSLILWSTRFVKWVTNRFRPKNRNTTIAMDTFISISIDSKSTRSKIRW